MNARIAGVEDAERLLDLMEDFNRIESIPFARATMRQALLPLLAADNHLGRVVIADADAATIGYALVTFGYDLEYGGRDAWLTELYLVASARARGDGKRLLDDAVAVAKAAGAHAMHLQVRHENGVARAVYERAGFTVWTRLGYSKRPL
ncbi:MAG TPA: GNAT family N-acetyltransferase [Polyangia bacterium]|jgi:ribosomal protein S18 acetylase RimI-like enzyme|nr:GNAT family N-acetyltransferase [Polyangia bacterium]